MKVGKPRRYQKRGLGDRVRVKGEKVNQHGRPAQTIGATAVRSRAYPKSARCRGAAEQKNPRRKGTLEGKGILITQSLKLGGEGERSGGTPQRHNGWGLEG